MHDHFDLSHALQVASRRGWIVAVSILSAVGAAYAVTAILPERYEATATLFVGSNSPSRDASLDLQYATLAQSLVATYAKLAETRTVAEEAAEEAGVDVGRVRGSVRADAEVGLQILKLHARSPSPAEAAVVANALGDALEEHVEDVNKSRSAQVGVQVVDPAVPPRDPVSPKPFLNLLLGGLLGLLLGTALAVARERLDRRVRTAADVERELGLPVLGVVPRIARRTLRRDALTRHENHDVAEPFRTLAATIERLPRAGDVGAVLVTSARRGEGKTTVASHLALALAEDNHGVALVEGDLRRPSLRRHFPTDEAPSLDTVMYRNGQRKLPKTTGVCPGLKVVAAEERYENAAHVLRAPEFDRLLAAARDGHDYVIVDSPAALPVSDASVLSRHADTIVLVVRAGVTRDDDVRAARAAFKRLGVEVAGVVLVGGKVRRTRKYAANGRSASRNARQLADVKGERRATDDE